MSGESERAARRYRQWLALAPPHLRERYGREMTDCFVAELERARMQTPGRVSLIWLGAFADLAFAWLNEPRRRWLRRGRVGIPSKGRAIMLGSDIRYALRSLARQKFATGLVTLMLGLGIAANVAVFSLVNGLFFRPFPFDQADRLVFINETAPKWNLDITGVNFPDFDHWRKGQRQFEGLAVWSTADLNLAEGASADRVPAVLTSHELADVLRIRPVIGRMFTPDEDKPKGPAVVVLTHGLWHERFRSNTGVLGQTLKLNGRAHTIIGVLPPEADSYPGDVRLWVPLQGDPSQQGQSYSYNVLGRLKSGITPAQGEADLLRAHQPIFDTRDKDRVVTPFVMPLREINVRDFRTAATTLGAAVAMLLLVACANVAAVMLARALSRRREMGIRVAVGAGRWRLVRQLFVENVILALIGGVVGLALGQWGIRALIAGIPDGPPPWATFGLDGRVMAFAVLTSVVTVLVFGWIPALHATRGDLRSAMNNVANAAISSHAGRRTLRALIGAEFALATLLVVCGGLLFRAYDRVQHIDPGFTPDNVLTFTVSLPSAVYSDRPNRLAFWDEFESRLATLPGVRSAAIVNCPPFGCHWGSFYIAEGAPPRSADEANPVVLNRHASPSYFATMGIRLNAGRFFNAADGRTPDGERVAIVNETFSRTFFPGVESPVGRRFRSTGDKEPWNLIVGYVADVKHYGLERPMRPGIYWPLAMSAPGTLSAAVKSEIDAESLAPAARSVLRQIDPELPMFRVRTMERALAESMALRTTYSWMLAIFALTALMLALGGTYGVSSYLVTQRTREIGIRVALGAARGDIVRSVLHGSLITVSLGIFVGMMASLGAGTLLETLLFGVKPHDGVILTGATAVLVLAAMLANVLPARRAAKVDPMISLRTE